MNQLNQAFQTAMQLYKSNDLKKAALICAQIIQTNPNHPETLLLGAIVLNKLKKFEGALQLIERALLLHPAKHAVLTEKGIAKMGLYQLDEAENSFRQSIEMNPNYEKSHIQLAICKKQKREPKEAEEILKHWISIKPTSVSALNNLANLYTEQNRTDEAETYYRKTIEVDPNNAKALVNIGYFEYLQGNSESGITNIRRGLDKTPNDSFAISKLALVTAQNGQTDIALDILDQAVAKKILDSEIVNTYGLIFFQTGQYFKAKNAFEESLLKKPNHPETMVLLGKVYTELGNLPKAAELISNALALNPWNEDPKFDLATIYQFLSKEEEAFGILKELYEKRPDDANVIFSLSRLLCDLCEWDTRAELEKKFIEQVEKFVAKDKEYPFRVFNFNYFDIPIGLQLDASKQLARYYLKQVEAIRKQIAFEYNWAKHERIRIGYMSPDFRSHPIGQVVYHMFQYHDRSRFEVYGYALTYSEKGEDLFRDTIKNNVDHFINLQNKSFEEAAKIIHADEIDILIDLAGYTTYSKPQILALRPAPVQILFMGQPDSSGADFIDYYIADTTLVPIENQKYYTEKILYLPSGYFGSPLPVSEKRFKKSDFGIPEYAFVFCCFCNTYKYEPRLFSAWMKILEQVPDGILWLSPAKNNTYKKNILTYCTQHGINPARIYFAERLPLDEYMARYAVCDLFLDTLHYSAGSTAIASLLAGVPMVTTTGTRNAENMGASICRAVNLHETVCSTVDEYIEISVKLAKNPNQLKQLKEQLIHNKENLQLFDVKGFVAKLEEKLMETQL